MREHIGFLRIVRDEYGSAALFPPEVAKHSDQPYFQRGVERGKGFVHQNQIGRIRKGARDRNALCLAARKFGRIRVCLFQQFRPVEQLDEHRKRIEIQALSAIHFDTLRVVAHDKMPQLPDDTLYLQSVWKTGDFLNLRYRIDYHSRPHSIMLVADEDELSGDTLKVELRHSRNDDPEGHWSNLYSSFNIEAYRKRPYTTLQLYVNQVNFNYKYYYFKLN